MRCPDRADSCRTRNVIALLLINKHRSFNSQLESWKDGILEYWVILQRTEKFIIPETILFLTAGTLSDVLKISGLTKRRYSLFSGL